MNDGAGGVMFDNLLVFSFERSGKQALAWYICFLLLGGLLGGVVSGVTTAFFSQPGDYATGFKQGIGIGAKVSLLFDLVIGIALIASREKNLLNIFLLLLSVCLALVAGALGGLIPLAFLTTRPARPA
jgi:hypothetical protein